MKCLIIKVSVFLLLIPTLTFANWQVSKPQCAIPSEPFFQGGAQRGASIHNVGTPVFPIPSATTLTKQPVGLYAISVSGSLKENIERIMDRYHWRVVWKAPYDYNFDGRVTGTSLPSVVQKLIKPFPLQAKMYMSNRTMLVVPRDS